MSNSDNEDGNKHSNEFPEVDAVCSDPECGAALKVILSGGNYLLSCSRGCFDLYVVELLIVKDDCSFVRTKVAYEGVQLSLMPC